MRLCCQPRLKRSILCFLFLLFLIPSKYSLAQGVKKYFKGQVITVKGDPVIGANVVLKGETMGSSTNASGAFSIEAVEGDKIVISSLGFTSQEVTVSEAMMIILTEGNASALDEVVVVAYGTQRKKDITGSVAVVNVNDAKKTATYDVAKMLQGQVAGVQVQSSGEPGSFVNIKIRGVNSFIANGPLFVVDGIALNNPYDFATGDIETIQVLKDASSAALYGVRAAGGVVIITTKKGKNGPIKINYSGSYGFQQIGKKIAMADRVGYQKIVNAGDLNAGLAIAPGNDPSNAKFISSVNTDWQKEAFKTGNIQDHNVSFSGGSEVASFNVSLGYFNQTGTLKGPQKYDRYTLNMGMQGKKGRFSYGAKTAFTQSLKNGFGISVDHAVFGGIVTNMLTAIPTMPLYDTSRKGGYGGTDQLIHRAISLNVIGMNNLVTDNDKRNRMFTNFWGEIELLKNLKYKINLAYDKTNFKNFHYEPKYDLGWYYLNNQYFLNQRDGIENLGTIENTLTYQYKIGNHKINLLGGTSYIHRTYEDVFGKAKGIQDLGKFINFGNITSPTDKSLTSYSDEANLVSYFGGLNYNYDDKYLLSANLRNDASSKFGPDFKNATFPSIAAAWNIANEKAFHLPEIISSLKLRAGYGVLGNESVLTPYPYDLYLNPNASYSFNNALASGGTALAVVDTAIRWETTKTFNTALDIGLIKNRLTFTIEYYKRTSTNLHVNLPLASSVGANPGSVLTNAASTENSGFEFTLNYIKSSGNIKYNVNANLSTLNNKVLKLGGTNNPIYGAGSKTEVGRSIGELFGFVTEGIFQNTAEVASHAKQNNAMPGDVKFKDTNGRDAKGALTGKPDGTITDDDRVYLGKTVPSVYYGLNLGASYKNFDVSIFFQGVAGDKVFNGVYQRIMSTEEYRNVSVDALNYWTPTNTKTNIPRPVKGDPNQNARFSDRFVESGSYLKLQNMQIGYNIPVNQLSSKSFLKNARMYISGQNLLTFSGYRGYDPDFISDGLFSRGFDYGSFPNPRTIMFGLQLGF